MYNTESIQALIDRVGWALPVQPSTIELTTANTTSNSGRYFNGFHRLITVENVFSSIPTTPGDTPDGDALNAYLLAMKKDAVLKVLSMVFDLSDRANFSYSVYNQRATVGDKDYSDLILSRAALFDNAIGYQQAVNAIELMATTTRINSEERRAKLSYQQLKIELDGITDDNTGRLISKGVLFRLSDAVKKASEILFPVQKAKNVLRRSNAW